MKKILTGIAIMGALALTATGCASSDPGSETGDELITVRFREHSRPVRIPLNP